ncbi:MAG TPA: carbohydrate ABC transporter permease [Polyangiaceae bacterium]|jgi:multiple sugar transport system permease protein
MKRRPSPNPLQRTHPLVHVPLLILAGIFTLPLLWLIATSFEPREQIGKVPPEWLPRQYYIERQGAPITVTPPVPFEKGWVHVSEWSPSKYHGGKVTSFLLRPRDVKTRIAPVWQNYPEAIRALSSSEQDKQRPLGELLARSSMPWTPKSDRSKSVTFLSYLANTLLVALLGMVGTVASSALVAYGLSRIEWRGRSALFNVTLATMMVPFPVLMIPLYGVFRSLGWIGTLLPLWVPAFCGGAFNIFLLRQFFLTIPSELSDAARIDGCSEFGIFWRIILPLARPALAVVALFHFLYAWNDFLGPLIYLTEPRTFTMALGLSQYQSQNGGSEWHLLMAASVLLIAPVVALFFVAQRTFIQGISTTGMGGR